MGPRFPEDATALQVDSMLTFPVASARACP